MPEMLMELRSVDTTERLVTGVATPYDEITRLAGDPGGERMVRGAFKRSIVHRRDKIPLLDNHNRLRVMGRSTRFDDTAEGLIGTFRINGGDDGDRLLADLDHGYYGGMSIGFVPLDVSRGADGVREVREAKLVEVSLVGVPAYEGAGLISVRNAQSLDELLAPFLNRPVVNLDPVAPIRYR